jgi:hypothetical protein
MPAAGNALTAAVYGFFVHDDGRISYRYYRSDCTFQEERGLDFLRGLADYRNQLEAA